VTSIARSMVFEFGMSDLALSRTLRADNYALSEETKRMRDSEQARFTDVYLFGEAGLFGARRIAEDGSPARIKPGPHGAPRELPGTSIAGEILLTPRGTLGLRGPMVPIAAYAPPPPPSDSMFAAPSRDYVDTDYAARLDRSTGAICITAPPPGIMAVGGYRFLSLDLQEWTKRLGQGALLTALPDRLSGHRLAGRAQDNARAFHNVMQDVQLSRQRNGAYGWSIARDIADPELWTERYHCPTWLDYLRQRNRATQSERALHQRAIGFHLGPDAVRIRRMLERPFGSVRWKEDTPDRAASEVLPVVATAAGSST